MSHAEWGDVWSLIVGLMAKEPVYINLLIVLAAGFFGVMTLEGIRTTFFPRKDIAAPVIAAAPQEQPLLLRAVEEAAAPPKIAAAAASNVLSLAEAAPQPAARRAYPRRSSPQKPLVFRARKPSA